MVQSLFTGGVGIYGFYALQPYLLELYGDPEAYQIAGLSAAIVAGAQILGGLAAPGSADCSAAHVGAAPHRGAELDHHGAGRRLRAFWAAIALTVVWALLFAASTPIRQAYVTG